MNFKDAVYLTNEDIKGSMLTFVREKTKRTNTVSEKEIKVHLHEEVKKIIDKWGNPKGAPTDFIFPVFNNYSAAIDRERRRKTYQRWINRSLNAIGVKLGFEDRLCLNLVRHSFATRLKLDGTPLACISDAMGHANSKTTEHYMKSIPDEIYKNISKSLLDF